MSIWKKGSVDYIVLVSKTTVTVIVEVVVVVVVVDSFYCLP